MIRITSQIPWRQWSTRASAVALACTTLAACGEDPALKSRADELLARESSLQRECIDLRTEIQLQQDRLNQSKLADFDAMIRKARIDHDNAILARDAMKKELDATRAILQSPTPP